MAELDRRNNGDLQTGAGAHLHVHGFLRRDGTRVAPSATHPRRRDRSESTVRSRHHRHREYIRQFDACVRSGARQQGRHRRHLLPRSLTDGLRAVHPLQSVRGDRHARRPPGDRCRLQQRHHWRLQGGVPVPDRRFADQTQDHFHVSLCLILLTLKAGLETNARPLARGELNSVRASGSSDLTSPVGEWDHASLAPISSALSRHNEILNRVRLF